jgi:hypothetical protein
MGHLMVQLPPSSCDVFGSLNKSLYRYAIPRYFCVMMRSLENGAVFHVKKIPATAVIYVPVCLYDH